ncbi:Metallo-dependent phosphatase-like protein [Fennellomyces sp. T-0311]|nr:Metallo-dependent phosphatase-like protein [Fennellomyces sp. T-0311]
MRNWGWAWLLLVFVCSLRACYLYWQSTADLRAARSGFPWHRLQQPQTPVLSPRSSHNDSTVIDATPSNLFYFTQISDLHLSKYRARGHTLHFLHFVRSILPIIKPNFVVVTGDLTDAKDVRRITSQQYYEEWQVYRQTIEQGAKDVPWYDMRGNHDCFDLPSWQSHVNFYRTHGMSADRMEAGRGVYQWQITPSYGQYRFVAIDACPKRGPSRPFNFFGYLTSKTMDRLADALQPESHYNHTFVFSHYPTTTMVFGVSSKGHGFRDLAKLYSVYFCGHLHRLTAGLGEILKWYDPQGQSLELELGDMMVHGVYRIVAVDHDLISFVDVELPRKQLKLHPTVPLQANGEIEWPAQIHPAPIVLITNPKDARYALPHKEPLHRIQQSQHIRFLVFSQSDQLEVSIAIDGQPHFANATKSHDSALWTAPWDPNQLDPAKLHTIEIRVIGDDGQQGSAANTFRLDGHRAKIAGGPGEFIISSNMTIVLQGVTLFAIAVMLLVLVLPKFYDNEMTSAQLLSRIQRLEGDQFNLRREVYLWTLRFLELPRNQPSCWIASVLFILSLITLPWFRAEFIPSAPPDERYGTFYLWGLKFSEEWIPIADTWMFAAGQIWLDVVVFVILFAWRSTDDNLGQRQLHEHAWFKGLEVVYWLWRVSELMALAAFYGGASALIYNVLVVWITFVGYNLAWGKGGMFNQKRRSTFPKLCPCDDESTAKTNNDDMVHGSSTSPHTSGGESSGSASSTPFNGSPLTKSRKRGLRRA